VRGPSSSPPANRRYVFLDEAGNVDFSSKPGASRYFIVTSVTLGTCAVGDELLALRRDLLWTELMLASGFHANDDRQSVRDAVFELLSRHPFRVDTTLVQKTNVDPHLRSDTARLYKVVVFKHLSRLAKSLREVPEVQVTCASLGMRREQEAHVEPTIAAGRYNAGGSAATSGHTI